LASVPSSRDVRALGREARCAAAGLCAGFRRGTIHRRSRTREASTKVVYFFLSGVLFLTVETGDARFISSFISEQSLDATLERRVFRLFERANGVRRGVARRERAGGVIAELVGRKRRFHGDAGELGAR